MRYIKHSAIVFSSMSGSICPRIGRQCGPPPRDDVAERDEALQPVFSTTRPDSGTLLRYAEIASRAGIEAIREAPDEAIVQNTQAACVDDLLTPKLSLSEIPEPVGQMVTAMALYASGTSLSQRGRWCGGKAQARYIPG